MNRLRRAMPMVGVALALVVAADGVPATAAKRKPSCGKRGDTYAQNRYARVFAVRDESEGDVVTTLYGCHKAVGRKFELTGSSENRTSFSDFGLVVLNRRFVAWEQTTTAIQCSACEPVDPAKMTTTAIYRVDLRTRREERYEGDATALVVSRTGTPAWIEVGDGTISIRAGDGRTIDTGEIDAESFEIRGTTLSWTKAGKPQSAPLP